LLPRVGRLIDRFGVRLILCCNAALFAIHLVLMSYLPVFLSKWLAQTEMKWAVYISMACMTFGIMFLRFLGQGTLPLLGSTMIGKWFSGKRGRASSISSVVVGLAFSFAPVVMNEMVLAFGYRDSWHVCALVICFVLLPFALIFSRDTPESCGINVEWEPDSDKDEPHQVEGVSLQEAQKTTLYWAIILPLAIHALVFTGFTFHILGITQELQLEARSIMSIFVYISVIGIPLGFFFSRWSDHHEMVPLILLMACAQIVGYSGTIFLYHQVGYLGAILGFGLTSAAFSPLFSLGMAKYFGRKHLGEIQGKLSSIMVMASSLGPLILSLFRDVFHSFQPGLIFFASLPISVLVLLIWGKGKLN
jgi:MFS family permease